MPSKLHERGLEMRKQVLGAEQVEATLATVDQFTQPLQEVINEYVWGAVWARPGIEPRIRSMLTISTLTALNRPHELKLHVHAALNNGLTRDEIGEVLLQTAVYCGIAAAQDSFRIAQEAFRERTLRDEG